MRNNHLQEFRDEIFNKEVKCGESEEIAKEYVNGLVKLLFNYMKIGSEEKLQDITNKVVLKNNNKILIKL